MNIYAIAGGLSWPLVSWAIVFSLVSVVVLSFYMPIKAAIPIVSAKYILTVSYFAFWSGGLWFIGNDDVSFFEHGLLLVETGYNPISILSSVEGGYYFQCEPSGCWKFGSLAIYRWWNMLWIYLIAPEYYAPVLANVFVTVLSGCVFVDILRNSGFSEKYQLGFIIFFLLHWDVVAWSSFLNLKEPLITLLLLLSLRSVIGLVQLKSIVINIIVLGVIIYLFQGIRFYYPVLIAIAGALYLMVQTKNKVLVFAFLLVAASGMIIHYSNYFGLIKELVYPTKIFVGLVRELLSPLPWKVTDPATYLIPGSILHIILLPGALIGAYLIIKCRSPVLLIILFVVVGFMFYAAVPRLASPRHRAPLMALWILLEYQFIWSLLSVVLSERIRFIKKEVLRPLEQ